MYVLGITGLYCSGKTFAGNFFVENGFKEIDVDKLGHIALSEKTGEVVNEFGKKILNGDNTVNRKKLGAIVFSDEKKLELLESIVHPYMVKMVKDLLDKYKNDNVKYVVINAAILFKMKLHTLCNEILAITAPEEIIIKRGLKRDNISAEQIKRRVKKQKIYNENFKSADYLIENKDNFKDFVNKLKRVLNEIKESYNGE